jgi:hypothetical protein
MEELVSDLSHIKKLIGHMEDSNIMFARKAWTRGSKMFLMSYH